MKIVNMKELNNPREFRVVHVTGFPTLFEIRDRNGKLMMDEKFINKLRAEEILEATLAKGKIPLSIQDKEEDKVITPQTKRK